MERSCPQRMFFSFKNYLFFILFSTVAYSQTASPWEAPIKILWDQQTSCQVFDHKDFKDISELISEGICIRVCENSRITYTLSGNNAEWISTQWNAGGGIVVDSDLLSCTVEWGASGSGSLSVSIQTDTRVFNRELCLEIIKAPKSKFGIFPEFNTSIEVCANEMLYFTNLSTSDGGSELVSYYWDFGDNSYSSAFEPSHAFSQSGTYNVLLTVRNSCNCTSTYEIEVLVKQQGLNIECANVVCEGATATYFLPQQAICSSFQWSASGGTIMGTSNANTVQVNWDSVDDTGFGYLMFDAAASGCAIDCASVTTLKVPVITSTATIKGEILPCNDGQYRYSLPQWPDTDFKWSLDDNVTGAYLIPSDNRNEIVINTADPGELVLRVVYRNMLLGCGGTGFLVINVKKKAVIVGAREVCKNSNETYYMDQGYAASWVLKGPSGSIQTGSGNSFTAAFGVSGKYDLAVASNSFCSSENIIINVKERPATPGIFDIIGNSEICINTPLTFTMDEVPGTATYWEVSVGGEIIGSNVGNEVVVTYNSMAEIPLPAFVPKIRAYRMSTSFPYCKSNTFEKILFLPQISQSIEGEGAVCPSSAKDYEIAYADGDIYEWSVIPERLGSVMGNNGSREIKIMWNEPQPGDTATLRLRVRKCGSYIVKDLPITFKGQPMLAIDADASVCNGLPLEMNLSSTGLDSFSGIRWDFGDGTSETTSYPITFPSAHEYNIISQQNINFTVRATVLDANGCKDIVVIKNVTITPGPVAKITPSAYRSICQGSVIDFALTAQDVLPGQTIQWFHDDVPQSLGTTYQVTQYGEYYAIITNSNGCFSKTNVVRVDDRCQQGGVGTACPNPHSVSLNVVNSSCGTITATATTQSLPESFSWSVYQGTIQSQNAASAVVKYAKAGLYYIDYSATINGCARSVRKSALVPYIAKLKYEISCGNSLNNYTLTLFDDSDYYPGVGPITRKFKVDGQVVYEGALASYSLPINSGNHNFEIEIVAPNGTSGNYPSCTASKQKNLPAVPELDFFFLDDRCAGEEVRFSPPTEFPQGLKYSWDFGGGAVNTLASTVRTFSSGGNKQVTLTVTNEYGCSYSKTKIVRVINNLLNGEILPPARACKGSMITLQYQNLGLSIPSAYYWMKGKTQIGVTQHPQNTFQVSESGNYWVIIEDINGCHKRDISEVSALFSAPPHVKVDGPSAVCVGEDFVLSTSNIPGAVYQWKLYGGIVSDVSSINLSFSETGIYEFEVRVSLAKNGIICTTTEIHQVEVFPKPEMPFVWFDINTEECEKYTTYLYADSGGEEGTFTWSNGMTGAEVTVNEGGAYKVYFTNLSGCTSEAGLFVPKNPENYLWVFPSGCYDLCYENKNSVLIGPSPYLPFEYWQWQFNGITVSEPIELSVVNDYNIVAIEQAGTYNLILDNGYCQKSSKPMNVKFDKCDCKYKVDILSIEPDSEPFCHYKINLHIDNPFGYPHSVTVFSADGIGIFQPSSFVIPVGGGNFEIDFIPTVQFNGGSVSFSFQSLDQDGKVCIYNEKFHFPPSCTAARNMRRNNDSIPVDFESLMIVPNPVISKASINYRYQPQGGTEKSIEIYNIMGSLLEIHRPKDSEGSWDLLLDAFPSGTYIVVMRENGSPVLQRKLLKK